MRILLVEDDKGVAEFVLRGLKAERFVVDWTAKSEQALFWAKVNDYDLGIMDIQIEGNQTGLQICRSIREKGRDFPIIMLSVIHDTAIKIEALNSGADDYLVKPFSLEELLSRVRALARRPRTTLFPNLSVGNLTLNPTTQEVHINDSKVEVTLKEFRILEFFMHHPDHVLTRQKIIDHLWDFNFNPFSRVMDVHINNVRNKLLKHKHGPTLETVRGVGYRLRA